MVKKPVALISGVGRTTGIGAGIARKLSSKGWDLALTYWPGYDERMPWGVEQGGVENLRDELTSAGTRVTLLSADFVDPTVPPNVVREAFEQLGQISCLILSHCESVPSGILDTSLESFERHFAVNVRAAWQLLREFALQIPKEGGSVIALTSDATVHNLPYGASKGALDRIVLAAARELASRNIRANVVNPGPVDTGWMDEDTKNAILSDQPSGRLGTPEDTANLIAFLVSPEGSWINGQLLRSDGGLSIQAAKPRGLAS